MNLIKDIYKFINPRYQNLFLDYKVRFRPRYGYDKPPHQELYHIINTNRSAYQKWIEHALNYREVFCEIKNAAHVSNPMQPGWNNGFLPGLDIIMLYTLISIIKPEKYIEIGSGNSTRVVHKAKTEGQLSMQITSIDPQPRAEMDALADNVIREPFENIDYSFLDDLKQNDILFIDNSHRILPNSDAMVFFLEVMPRLKKGVIVHLHDIYLPYDYPQFMCDRYYSEQYGLAMYLLANPGKYETMLPNYFIYQDKELSALLNPLWEYENLKNVERRGGSYWLRIAEDQN